MTRRPVRRGRGTTSLDRRHHYDPNEIIEDCSNAVSYPLTRGEIDAEGVAVVGAASPDHGRSSRRNVR